MKEDLIFDTLIIGAGPIGLACGIEASKAGLAYLIIDKGCLVNSIYNYPLNMSFFSTSERLEIGEVPFISHNNKPNRTEALEYYRRVGSDWSLNMQLYEAVEKIGMENDLYKLQTSANIYLTRSVIIATGFYDIANQLNVEGEHLPKVHHYYKEAHPYSGQKIAVIGAANSAVDVALETFRKGAEVTMIVRGSEISNRVKYWVKPDIENRIKEGSIKAYFNSSVLRIREKELDIKTTEGEVTIGNDFVLAMTGYKPDFSLLQSAGIEFQDNIKMLPLYNPETMESSKKNIYLAGVVCGGMDTHKWFIENSRVHATLILEDIKKKRKVN